MSESTLPELTNLAAAKAAGERLRSVSLLEALGHEAAPTLIGLLGDRDAAVRLASAQALGRVGDLEAVRPLVDALVGPHTGGKGRWHSWIGVLSYLGLYPLAFAVAVGPLALQIAAGLGMAYFFIGPIARLIRRDEHKAFADAVSNALVAIAKRHPSGTLAEVVPELQQSAGDRIMQSDEARAASKRAAGYLEDLGKDLRTTPIAAEAPEAEPAAVLPLPAESPDAELEALLHPKPEEKQQEVRVGLG